jgi:predicted DNA-binding transcriptional regulator AlpA
MAQEYIRIGELQELFGNRSVSAIRNDVIAGRLPKPVMLGRVRYWKKSQVDAALQKLLDETQ